MTQYLSSNIGRHADDMALDPEISRVFLRNGDPVQPGHRLVQGDYAESLKLVATEGAAALHGWPGNHRRPGR